MPKSARARADDDVLGRLGTDESTGLTEEEAARRLKAYGPNIVLHHHSQTDSKHLAALKCILFLWGWDHSFTEYIKCEIGWESWEQLIFPWSKEMMCIMLINFLSWMATVAALVSLALNSAAGQTTYYELSVIVYLLVGSLAACFVAKLLANHAKALLESKAFSQRSRFRGAEYGKMRMRLILSLGIPYI
uniref:Cation-transporting P-type ATPase N-terminal domain-containing protein n=1 Tax=Leersia perrieri TaxID=77586 RepID=A0A0D9XS60_9ORYZ